MDDTDEPRDGLTARGRVREEPPVPLRMEAAERRRLQVRVLLFLSAGAALLLGRMLWPFLTAIIAALVLAVLAFPAYVRLRDLVGNERIAAGLGTVALFFLVFLPVVGLSLALFASLQDHADMVAREMSALFGEEGPARRLLSRAQEWLGLERGSLTEGLQSQIRELGGFLAGRTMGILSGLGGGLVQAGVALFTLFFLLLDGEALLEEFRRVVPLDDELTDALMRRSGDIIFATMVGSVVVGIAQGTLGGLAFWALDIPGAILWGAVMGLLGIIPVLGPPLVWVPTVGFLLAEGEIARAIALLLAGMLIVGTVDNVLRAAVVSGRAQLHPLVVFFSALGGLILFGVMGIFLGPILFVLSLSILEVTRVVLDPDGPTGAD